MWGEARVWEGSRTGTDGWAVSQSLIPALEQPFRFQGQQFDAETGLHYNRYRYYDPVVGRYVSQDPIGLWGGINIFRYANNPLLLIDPFGLSPAKDNIAKRKNCACKWSVENSDRVCEGHVRGVGVAKYFRNPTTGEWWSEDLTGHGGSAWKVFDMKGGTLEWKADADKYGDFIGEKHKGGTGVKVSTKDMRCKNL